MHCDSARREEGSALVLVPVVALSVVMTLVSATVVGALGTLHAQLRNLAASCALAGARALSLAAWEAHWILELDAAAARLNVASCMAGSGPPGTAWSVTVDSPTTLLVSVSTPIHLPLLAWLDPGSLTVHAEAAASEVPAG